MSWEYFANFSILENILILVCMIMSISCLIFFIYYINLKTKQKQLETKILRLEIYEDELIKYAKENERLLEQIKIYENQEIESKNDIPFYPKNLKKNFLYKGQRVLIGNYQEDSSEYLRKILKSYGLIVDVVRKAEDVVDRINDKNYRYEIIFSNNLYRNGVDGQGLLRELKNIKDFKIPVIVNTVDKDKEKFIFRYGFNDYLSKPANPKEVDRILKEFLKSSKTK